jgi:hypothetical protein
MALFRGIDGKFYQISDEQLKSFEVSAEEAKEIMSKEPLAGTEASGGVDIADSELDNVTGGSTMHQRTISAS